MPDDNRAADRREELRVAVTAQQILNVLAVIAFAIIVWLFWGAF